MQQTRLPYSHITCRETETTITNLPHWTNQQDEALPRLQLPPSAGSSGCFAFSKWNLCSAGFRSADWCGQSADRSPTQRLKLPHSSSCHFQNRQQKSEHFEDTWKRFLWSDHLTCDVSDFHIVWLWPTLYLWPRTRAARMTLIRLMCLKPVMMQLMIRNFVFCHRSSAESVTGALC